VPFKITNTGLLAVRNVVIRCYIHHVEVGQMIAAQNLVHRPDWDLSELGREESKTIICQFIHAPTMPGKADIAIVIDYSALGVPFKTLRSVFRFEGAHGDTWQWLPQPSVDIRANIDERISYWKDRHKKRQR
jgi:hypothetical protein